MFIQTDLGKYIKESDFDFFIIFSVFLLFFPILYYFYDLWSWFS